MVSASPAVRRQASSTDNCVAKDNKCRTTRGADGLSANQAQCSADNAACQGVVMHLTTLAEPLAPMVSPQNMAQCASEYASCLGENPIASTGGLISSFHSLLRYCIFFDHFRQHQGFFSQRCCNHSAAAASGCKAKDNKCRTTRMADGSSANQAQCSVRMLSARATATPLQHLQKPPYQRPLRQPGSVRL